MRIISATILLLISLQCFTQTTYNFELGSIAQWSQFPADRWDASTDQPISGTYSLRQIFDNSAAGLDAISTPLVTGNLATGRATWRFKLRHGYDPSGSNRWWFLLMANGDASTITTGTAMGTASGYAVGVNVVGSTDLVALYKIEAGTPTAIVTSTVNWQTQIGKATPGAIEVTRTETGSFTLKISTTGDFGSLVNEGTAYDNTFTQATHMGLAYQYTASADRQIWLDDVEYIYQPLNANDATTTVELPVTQVTAGRVSSTATQQSMAVEVLRFTISDKGTTDGLPTRPKQVEFIPGANNRVDWATSLGGAALKNSTGTVVSTHATIGSNAITIAVDSLLAEVSDGISREFSLWVYLAPKAFTDGDSLAFTIDTQNSAWLAGISGSNFTEEFAQQIASPIFTVDIAATRLWYALYPQSVIVNQPFSISINATDEYGSADADFNQPVTLALASGDGVLSSSTGLTKNAVAGTAHWNDIKINTTGILSINASSSGLTPAIGESVAANNDTTTVILIPSNQPTTTAIPSTTNFIGQAVEVFRFRVFDQGTGDGKPTIIRQIKLYRGEGENLISLSKVIAGLLIKVDGSIVSLSQPDIKTDYLTIAASPSGWVVPDGSVTEFSILVYLKTSGITDNQNLSLTIKNSNHGFETDTQGSSIVTTLPQSISSAAFPITVTGTTLKFTKQPTWVGVNTPFSVEVSATDSNGNIDTDYSGTIKLGIASGNGELVAANGEEIIAINGTAKFEPLSYNTAEAFTLKATATNLLGTLSGSITCGDKDGMASAPGSQIDSQTVSSTSNNTSSAFPLISFNISDGGTTDGLPINIQKLEFRNFLYPNGESLNQLIAGAFIVVDGEEVMPLEVSISADKLTLTFSDGVATIPNGDAYGITLFAYLKNSPIPDGSRLQLYIASQSHGWTTYPSGSSFADEFSAAIYGLPATIDVEATELRFLNVPLSVEANQPFSIFAVCTDSNGNLDKAFSGTAEVIMAQGTGELLVESNEVTISNGLAEWADASFTQNGTYKIAARAEGLTIATSNQIFCGFSNSCPTSEPFESNSISTYPGANGWFISDLSPISGSKSLQHKPTTLGGTSYLSMPMEPIVTGEAAMEWKVTLRNGAWDPSSENTFWFVLGANDSDFTSAALNGYAVGVRALSDGDWLSVWKITQGKAAEVIVQSEFDWNESQTVDISVKTSPLGDWYLGYTLWGKGGYSSTTAPVRFAATDTLRYMGPVFSYSQSRSGQLWVDNINFCKTYFPPQVTKATPLSMTAVRVSLSAIPATINGSTFAIKTASGQSIAVKDATLTAGKPEVLLSTDVLTQENLTLTACGLTNSNGDAVCSSITFRIGGEGSFNRVVINEVMSDPTPVVGLPEAEYIEVYNPSETDSISIAGWTLTVGNATAKLPDSYIKSRQHAILCATSQVSTFSAYGKAIGVSSFPSLPNSGTLVQLRDQNGMLVSYVDYLASWHSDSTKRDGGYSLERINPLSPDGGVGNWASSNAAIGGTPGSENSAKGTYTDNVAPLISWHRLPNEQTILVAFNEAMDSLSVWNPNSYSFQNNEMTIAAVNVTGALSNQVELLLDAALEVGKSYTLCISESVTDLSGNAYSNGCITIVRPHQPELSDIIINEVLFNPYTGGTDFVELYNRSEKILDLSMLSLANRDLISLGIKEVYSISTNSKLLYPGEYAVLSANSSAVTAFYNAQTPSALVAMDKIPAFASDMGYVVLLTYYGDLIDEMYYTEKMHHPLLVSPKGVSLERVNPEIGSNDSGAWQSASQAVGFATPTYANSQQVNLVTPTDEFTLSPETFSPNGDGIDDMLTIGYSLPEAGHVANIRIFTSEGKEVKRLASNLLLGTEGQIFWNGLNEQNQKVKPGIYLVYIERFDLKGNSTQYKKVCVVAQRL